MLNNKANNFIDALHEIGAIQFGVFTLRSKLKSPIYINLRLLRSFPQLLGETAEMLWAISSPHIDRVADIPTAATPLVTAITLLKGVPQITPREPKEYGNMAEIDGVYQAGQRVQLYDDLVTTAGSKFPAIKTLEDHGLVVAGVTVLVDREQGGKKSWKMQATTLMQYLLSNNSSNGTRLLNH